MKERGCAAAHPLFMIQTLTVLRVNLRSQNGNAGYGINDIA